MPPNRWQQIEQLCQSALELEDCRRGAFLDQACAGDEELRREVESLLQFDTRGERFIEEPALEVAARMMAHPEQESLVGRRVGPYEILSLLGRGGMGEVYRARDNRLDRLDALKILPREVASDPDRLRRFIREAKAASALNHPHIATIYEIGESEGIHWIAMELVEGMTLEAWSHGGRSPHPVRQETDHPLLQGSRGHEPVELALAPERGRGSQGEGLKLEEILDIGMQAAEGLEAAHKKGILHRDIKPANLMRTPEGQVKILDFGLAKRFHLLQPGTVTTTSTGSQTTAGLIMGTVEYMSPEQVLGQEVDQRTDLFSLGVVLYDLATGQLPFRGVSPTDTLGRILHTEPEPVSQFNGKVPAELERIIGKCLQKSRELRYQSAGELLADLKRLKRDTDSGRVPNIAALGEPPSKSFKVEKTARRWKWALIGVSLMIVIAIGVRWFIGHRVPPQPSQELKQIPLTSNSSEYAVSFGFISPDGKYLDYSDRRGIHLKLLATGDERPIPQPEGSTTKNTTWYAGCWFPDGTRFTATRLDANGSVSTWVFSVLEGPPRLLRENAGFGVPSPDGSQIAYLTGAGSQNLRSELWLMGSDGGNPRKFLAAAEGEWLGWLVWSPDSQRISYDSQRISYDRYHGDVGSIESRDLKGGPPTTIVDDRKFIDRGHWWLPNGRIVVIGVDGTSPAFWEIRVEPATGRPLSPPRRLLQWPEGGAFVLNGTTDGKRLALWKGHAQSDVYVGDWEAKSRRLKNPQRLTFDLAEDLPRDWTRDSKAILFHSNRNGQFDIFKQALDQESVEPIVTGPGNKFFPVLSPDGAWILYQQEAVGENFRIMRVPFKGGSPEMVLEKKGFGGFACSCSPASRCLIAEGSPDRKQCIFTEFEPMKGRGRELARVTHKQTYFDWDLARDGSQLAVMQDVPGSQKRIQILPLSGGETREVVIKREVRGMTTFGWAADGNGFFVGTDRDEIFVDLEGRADVLWKGEIFWGRGPSYGVPSPDGRHLAWAGATAEGNIWMLENF